MVRDKTNWLFFTLFPLYIYLYFPFSQPASAKILTRVAKKSSLGLNGLSWEIKREISQSVLGSSGGRWVSTEASDECLEGTGESCLAYYFSGLGQSNGGGPKGNLFITGSKSENTAIIKQLLKYQQPLKSLNWESKYFPSLSELRTNICDRNQL